MDVIKGLREDTPPPQSDASHVVSWPNLKADSVGARHELPAFNDRSIQVEGTWGIGGKLVIEGSNTDNGYSVLNDEHGVDLEFSGDGLRSISEAVRFIRPRVIGGDGTTNLTATLLVRRNA